MKQLEAAENTRSTMVSDRKAPLGRHGENEQLRPEADLCANANASPTSKEGEDFEEIYRAGAT